MMQTVKSGLGNIVLMAPHSNLVKNLLYIFLVNTVIMVICPHQDFFDQSVIFVIVAGETRTKANGVFFWGHTENIILAFLLKIF